MPRRNQTIKVPCLLSPDELAKCTPLFRANYGLRGFLMLLDTVDDMSMANLKDLVKFASYELLCRTGSESVKVSKYEHIIDRVSLTLYPLNDE